ncbi:MAG: Inner membrane protein YbjJ [Chroococcidiopsis sp. SAG 2025]|uniref:MFS transporter n=1 Tax=Chroococcidiopsis sp. SAG 2025 TaxID=171389 RepID=UPI002937490C|nr:MFS transporter [Chroococcidiopsis sp. SAG 2025]MDV2997334.1 Inner membrane protein YbjJ [Chroococcidiopsis sp. SAG 2025]
MSTTLTSGLPRQRRQTRQTTTRFAIAAMFFINGAVSGNWAARIPDIQSQLGLSHSALGVVLASIAVGLSLATPITGWLIARVGSRSITKKAALAYCLALPLPALASNLLLLAIALLVFGAIGGVMSLAMNAQGLAIERRYGRPLMSSFHGISSVGTLIGAATGGIVTSVGVPTFPHLLGVALLLGIVANLSSRRLLSSGVVTANQAPAIALPERSLIGLGIVAFCSILAEGAMANWSTIYLRQVLETEPGLAATGCVVFSLAMACGRFTGDRSALHFGSVKTVCFSGTLAAIGLTLSLIVSQPKVAIIGFACVGIGLSSIVPLVFSAAERTPGLAPGVALAAVTTTGYFGLLFGPPAIGYAAELLTLRGALGLVVVSSITIAVLAPTVELRHKN